MFYNVATSRKIRIYYFYIGILNLRLEQNYVIFFCLMLRKRLVEECELTNSDFPEAKSGLKRAQVLEKLTFIRKSLENVKTDHPEVQENRKILLDLIPK